MTEEPPVADRAPLVGIGGDVAASADGVIGPGDGRARDRRVSFTEDRVGR